MSLRSAFEVAGAATVVSSLWKIDDRASAEFMMSFYSSYWREGLNKGRALHAAQLEMLAHDRRQNDGASLPRTWGAFVLSGDWE